MSGRLFTLESSLVNTPTTEDFTIDYIPEIRLNEENEYEIGLMSASFWYSWKNIMAGENTNLFTYSVHEAGQEPNWKTIVIPDGSYQIERLNKFLHDQMIVNLDYYVTANDTSTPHFYIELEGNYSTLKAKWKINKGPTDYIIMIDMTQGKLHTQLLGFDPEIIEETTEAQHDLNIENGFNSAQIHCSIVKDSFVNSKQTDIIYNVVPEVPPAYQISVTPAIPMFLPIRSHTITQIRMKITDQTGKLLDLSQEPVSYSLYIRPITHQPR